MKTRCAQTNDLPQMKELWMEVFGDSESFTDFYFSHVFPRAEAFLIYDDTDDEEVLAAMLFSVPHLLTLHGEDFPSRYISGVATHPAYRHRGLMTQLLLAAEEEAKAAGVSFLYLAPVDPAIYEKAGYSVFGAQRHLLAATEDACAPFTARVAERDDAPALAVFANRELAAQAFFYEKRTAASFDILQKDLRSDGGELYLYFDADERLCGYLGAESETRAREAMLPKELGGTLSFDLAQGAKEGLLLMGRCFDETLWERIRQLAPEDIFLPELY